MATSAKHKGWLYGYGGQQHGILSAVNIGAQAGAAVLATNTALEGVLLGTPVTPALAVDSMIISNEVASGDILIAANNGGNSQAWLWVDSSAGTMTLYAAGVEQIRTALGAFVINEASADIDFRVETNNLQYAIYSDGGKDALVLGSNTDTSSADQLITVSRAARTATATVSYYDLRVAPAGAVTVPAGVTALVATASLVEPNITATGTVTRAATLHIASQPTEGGTANAAIFFGTAANIAGTTSITINDDSEDLDFRIETNDLQYAIYSDAGKNALVLGSNTDTSDADQLVTISRAARTATSNEEYYDFVIAPAGAVTITGATTSAIVATARFNEPNITATGTVTNATTVYIAAAPTEGGTGNYALWVDAGASRFDDTIYINESSNGQMTTGLTVNQGGADNEIVTLKSSDVTHTSTTYTEADTYGNFAKYSATTGGLRIRGFGSGEVGLSLQAMATSDDTDKTTGGNAYIQLQAYKGDGQAVGADANLVAIQAGSTTRFIFDAEGTLHSVGAGGTDTLGNQLLAFGAASDITMPAATAAALEISDGTTKFYAFDTRVTTVGVTTHALSISNYTLASAANAVATGLSLAAHTLNLTGNTQVTTQADTVVVGARTIAADGVPGACTVDEANTLLLIAPIEGANVTLTATSALRILTTTGTPTNQYGVYIESLSGGTSVNRGIYLAGANGIQFGVADDIIMAAATAAALEISDGTTKFYAFDTRVTTVGVTTHALDISDYTFASAAGAVATGLSLATHTLNLTGNTQVTTQCDTVVIGARTIAADGNPGACTVDEANTMLLVAPTEGANAVLTAASALRIVDGGGTPVNQYGIFIETLTAGATADYAIWVAGANAVHLGTEGTASGLLEISGGTSGTCSIIPAAATTSYTITLPPAANTNAGYQLTCAAGDTITSWAGPASLREFKDIAGEHDAQDALNKMLATKVYDFHYKEGKGTLDSKTNYVGIMADEAPWAMHHEGGLVNPINTLGYAVLGFQAMAERIAQLEEEVAALRGA